MVMDSNALTWGEQRDLELRERVEEGPDLEVLSRDGRGCVLSYKLTHDQLNMLSHTFEKLRHCFMMWNSSTDDVWYKDHYKDLEKDANVLFRIIDIEMRDDYYEN